MNVRSSLLLLWHFLGVFTSRLCEKKKLQLNSKGRFKASFALGTDDVVVLGYYRSGRWALKAGLLYLVFGIFC